VGVAADGPYHRQRAVTSLPPGEVQVSRFKQVGGHWPARAARALAIGAILGLLGGCGLVGGPKTVPADVPNGMTVTSPDVSQGVMGSAYTCHGAGKYPGLHWSGAPAGTKSLAVVMDDSAAPITPYIYWIVFDIGPQTTNIQAGQIPAGARQARNSKGSIGYDPPCPLGQNHSYRFTVYALGSVLRLSSGAGLKTAWSAIAGAAIARGRLPVIASP
jgi:Raf kinase inhibitor-like YbhB/YbcL family protein